MLQQILPASNTLTDANCNFSCIVVYKKTITRDLGSNNIIGESA